MKRVLALCALLAALAAAGCGSGAGSGPTDPAKLAPEGTLAYASFEIAPRGPERAGFDAAFGKLLGADPEEQIARGLVDAVRESGSKLDYAQDVKPWLGGTAAAVLTGVSQRRADYALLLASTDDDKARAAIDKDLQGSGATAQTYRGADYKLNRGTANGVVGHFLVAGTEKAFRAVVDASRDGKSLADTQQWHDSVGDRATGKVGLGYLDVKGILQTVVSQAPGAERVVGPLAIGLIQIHPFVATLDANPDSLILDISSPGTPADKNGPASASSPLIERMPADAWFALGLPQVGRALEKITAKLQLNPLIAGQYAEVTARIKQRTGLDLKRDLFAGIGDIAAFARGADTKSLGGGLVVQARDASALRRTVSRLPFLIRAGKGARMVRVRKTAHGYDVTSKAMPQPVQVRIAPPGAIAAYGAASMRAALAPGARLGQTDLFRKAAAAVGARPILFASLGSIFDLVKASPHGRNQRDFAQAAPRLAHLEYAAVGMRRDAASDVIRAVIGLR